MTVRTIEGTNTGSVYVVVREAAGYLVGMKLYGLRQGVGPAGSCSQMALRVRIVPDGEGVKKMPHDPADIFKALGISIDPEQVEGVTHVDDRFAFMVFASTNRVGAIDGEEFLSAALPRMVRAAVHLVGGEVTPEAVNAIAYGLDTGMQVIETLRADRDPLAAEAALTPDPTEFFTKHAGKAALLAEGAEEGGTLSKVN